MTNNMKTFFISLLYLITNLRYKLFSKEVSSDADTEDLEESLINIHYIEDEEELEEFLNLFFIDDSDDDFNGFVN